MRSGGPRVAVLGKARSILTWYADLQAGFRETGAEVLGIGTQSTLPGERRLQGRSGLKDLENPAVLERVGDSLEAFRPDLVVFQNRAGLPETVDERWERLWERVPFVGWLCDNLNRVPERQIPCFSRAFYFDSGCLPALERFYPKERHDCLDYLPLAVDPARYAHSGARARKAALVFAGKCSDHRKRFFGELRARGVALEVFGPGAGSLFRPWRGRRYSSASLGRMYGAYAGSLNLPQPGNTEKGLNLRAFEIPACGGVGMYPDVEDLERCFVPGREIVVFRDADDLARRAFALFSDPGVVEEIAAAGRRRVLGEHTFGHRARTILAACGLA